MMPDRNPDWRARFASAFDHGRRRWPLKRRGTVTLGALAAAGLRPGDLVISINGADAASADLSAYRAQIASGRPVDIRFERDGQIHTARLGIQ